LGNAAGPLIGGLLIETVGWRWIFWLNVPLTLVALAIGAWSITESFDETVPRRIDLTGLALITVGIGLFTLTFDRAPTWGWLSPTTVIAFGLSLAALAVFVVVENPGAMAPRRPLAFARLAIHGVGRRGHHRQHRLRRHDLPVDGVSAAGARS
jgi:MFS family permease